jgi:hypothetical protein
LPFPHEFTEDDPPDYLDIVMGFFLFSKDLSANNEVWVPKTREMMTSWLAVGFITWFCQFYETTGWIAQSEKDDKATGLVKYANILYSQQPEWLKAHYPLKRGDYGTAHRLDWANGSWFKALPQVSASLRLSTRLGTSPMRQRTKRSRKPRSTSPSPRCVRLSVSRAWRRATSGIR